MVLRKAEALRGLCAVSAGRGKAAPARPLGCPSGPISAGVSELGVGIH